MMWEGGSYPGKNGACKMVSGAYVQVNPFLKFLE